MRKKRCKARLHRRLNAAGSIWWYATEDGCRHSRRLIHKEADGWKTTWPTRASLVTWLRSQGYEVVGYGL